jgi:hypothetical protein
MRSSRLILDVNVGVNWRNISTQWYPKYTDSIIFLLQSLLNFEEQERHSRNPQPFDETALHTFLDNTLPETDKLDKCKSIAIVLQFANMIYIKWYISHLHA